MCGAEYACDVRDARTLTDGIFKLMSTPECGADEEVSLHALKVLKILSRKQENRQNFGRRGLNAVLRLLITER